MTMGKTGTITVGITKSGGTYGYVHVDYREEYDAINNYSNLVITGMRGCNTIRAGTFYTVGNIQVDGAVKYSWNGNDWIFGLGAAGQTSSFVSYSGAAFPTIGPIYHNADGTKTISLRVLISTYFGSDPTWYGDSNCSAAVSVALTPIPRASSVSAPNATIGAALDISVIKASSSFTHTLTYSFGNASGTIVSQASDGAVSWTPPMELCSQIPNAMSGDCTITCETYNGSTPVGTKTTTISLTVPLSVGLTVSDGWATLAPYHDGTAAAGMKAYVQGYSKAQVRFDSSKISAANAYGASIASYRITYNGKNYTEPYCTDVLSAAGTVEITATVIDSRGIAVNEDFAIHVESYVKPIVSHVSIFRCNSLGVAADEGTYLSVTATANISSIAGQNMPTMQLQIGNLMTVDIPSGDTVIVGDALVLSTSTYHIALTLRDSLGNVAVYTQTIPTADVFFHGRQGGSGAAFGKYAEADDLLEVDWNLKTKKDLTVEGDAAIGGSLNIGGKALWEYMMPVGYIWESSDPTSPAALFGGTWEQITDRVIVGAGGLYDVNSIGGEAEHTQTTDEMPSHTHQLLIMDSVSGGSGRGARLVTNGVNNMMQTTSGTGGGQPMNNMQPYIAKYIWERVE